MRALIVDDDAAIVELLEGYLTGRGVTVSSVADAASAREALRTTMFDVLVCDLGLPDGEGRDIIVAAQRAATPTPVVVTTGRATVDQAVAALESGASALLFKPFKLKALYDAVSRAVTERRAALLSERGHALLTAAAMADAGSPAIGDALVAGLHRYAELAGCRVEFDPSGRPLGPVVRVAIEGDAALLEPYVRAVHQALTRVSRGA